MPELLSVKINLTMKKALASVAESQGMKTSEFVRVAVQTALEKNAKQ